MEFIVNSLSSLQSLKNDKSIKNSARRIKLIINGFDTQEYEYQINKHYFACGCKQGTVGVYVSILFLSSIWLIDSNTELLQWKWVLTILFSSAIIGKVAGLVYSHFQFRKLYNELYIKFAEHCTPENTV